jgi:hypothetical protein
MTLAKKRFLESIEDILFEVQYAPIGRKNEIRKKYAKVIFKGFKRAMK